MILEVLVTLFALFALSRALMRLRKGTESFGSFLLWAVVWIGVIVIVLFPSITTYFARLVGIGRGIDLIVYVSILILFYSMYRIYAKLDSIQRDVTKVTREVAIKRAKKKR